MSPNFPAALAFVWAPGRDSPLDGFHVTKNDAGKGTKGGVIQGTWDDAVRDGIVTGRLADADQDQLAVVLKRKFWGFACDGLPSGLDLMLFNGRMMSGRFPWLFQQCLGFIDVGDCDGVIGAESIAAALARDRVTLINTLCGVHAAYLTTIVSYPSFARGWIARIKAVRSAALAMASAAALVA